MKPTDYTKLAEMMKDRCPMCGGKIQKEENKSKFVPYPIAKKKAKP